MFSDILHERFPTLFRDGILWIQQNLHVFLYPAELRVSIGLHLRDVRALCAEQLHELGQLR